VVEGKWAGVGSEQLRRDKGGREVERPPCAAKASLASEREMEPVSSVYFGAALLASRWYC
jgi:hypothetical protein